MPVTPDLPRAGSSGGRAVDRPGVAARPLSDGFIASMTLVGPAFLFAELWRGRPVIDQPGNLWIVPGAVMAAGFVLGGYVAGRRLARSATAFWRGALVALLTMTAIFACDLLRRAVIEQGLSWSVGGLWIGAAALTAFLGGVGGAGAAWQAARRRPPAQ
ncbi:MAG TPA: hypothetical protein VL961_10030 [Acidimicrobiales bacterium]|nr:hypothetical protein [Acidimicrobiales bacterium]